MADIEWRNVLLAGARGLQFTFGGIARALSGEQPVGPSGFRLDHDAKPSQSCVTELKKRGKKEKEGKKEKRAPSAYNLYVAEQMKLRKAQNPEIPHTEIFRSVALDWRTSSKNKKNAPGENEAPAMMEDPHSEDSNDEEAEGFLLEGTSDDEPDAEVTGRLGSPAREAEERERAAEEEKDKKKRKECQENGGTGRHRDEEEGAADKRPSKKGKR